MRKTRIVLSISCCVLLLGVLGAKKEKEECVTIQDGVLTYSAGHYLEGEPLTTGYDIFGYNYQGHMFNGSYANAYLGRYGFPPYEDDDGAYLAENPGAESTWVWPYRNDQLMMKWNDAWLSNKDCGIDGVPDSDPDGLLDRYYGFPSYIGSGAWLTNHMSGEYVDGDGKTQKWNCFIKIVAVPEDAVLVTLAEPWIDSDGTEYDNMWYAADGTEIGPEIWGAFAIIQEVYNDTGTGDHGKWYLSPAGPGFGQYAP